MAAVGPPTQSAASVNTVQFSTTPALYPAFDPSVSDYVVRCTGTDAVQVSVSNTDGSDTTTTVSVDGGTPTNGAFNAQVDLDLGQGFKITATQGGTSKDYYIRCLPDGFPNWTSQRPGSPQAEYYVVAPVSGSTNRYVTIYDTNGVPIWWIRPDSPHRPVDAKLLPNGEVLWTDTDSASPFLGLKAEHRRLDGSVIDDDIRPGGYQLDPHEVQLLDDGNYLVIGTYGRCCFDLSSHAGPSSATIRDSVIQEVTPAGSAVWTWLAADHVGLDEVQSEWWSSITGGSSPYDVFHLNSAIMDSSGDLLVSLRYTNAVFKLTDPLAASNPGDVIWKLGGSAPAMEPGTQLAVSGDPVFTGGGGFSGQHYPRYYDAGDGNLYVTLHDNGTNAPRRVRGTMYQIDESAMTATFVEDVEDSIISNAACCGSAAKLSTGNWVISWGGNTTMTETAPNGSRVFSLGFGSFSYRAEPVEPGKVTRAELRAGMDAQYPRAPAGPGLPDVIDAMTGEIEVVAIPPSLQGKAFVSQTHIRLMDEGTGFVTGPMPDFTYDSAFHTGPNSGGTTVTTPAGGPGLPAVGTEVHSILLHFDPDLGDLPFDLAVGIAQSATITFNVPILGAYVATGDLLSTDSIFDSGTSYSSNSGRAMEFTYNGDQFAIDPGRHELTVTMFGHNGGVFDEMRIILATDASIDAPPDTAITATPSSPTSSRSASFEFNGTDDVTDPADLDFECRLDGGGFAVCTSPAGYNALTPGSHTFEVRAIDESNNTDPTPDSATWTIVNTLPIADDQSTSTDEDTPVDITLTGSDADNDPLTFQILSGPSDGDLTGSGATRTYTPGPDFNGGDSFTFRTNDGFGNSAPATVSITVNPIDDPPATPTGFAVSLVSATQLSVTWNDVAGETSYDLEVSTGGPFSPVSGSPLAAGTTSYAANGLTTGQEHCYRIRAANGAGPSAYTTPVCETPVAAAPQDGLLRVFSNPAVATRISVDGIVRSDWGIEWLSMPAGSYEVCFSDVAGFATPACETADVVDGVTTEVEGVFDQLGLLKVDVSPAGLPATISVGGQWREEYGLYAFIEPGSYEVCWGDVEGYTSPACDTVNVTAGAETQVTGDFISDGSPAPDLSSIGFLRVTTNPPVASRLIVDGVPRSDWGLTWVKVPVGSHEVCFSDVLGFATPDCQTVDVVDGVTTEVEGLFVRLGLLKVNVSPAGLPVDVLLDGTPRNQFGLYAFMEPGTYTVCGTEDDTGSSAWSASCTPAVVDGGVQTDVTLNYTETPP